MYSFISPVVVSGMNSYNVNTTIESVNRIDLRSSNGVPQRRMNMVGITFTAMSDVKKNSLLKFYSPSHFNISS